MRQNGRRTKLIESASKALANATFAKEAAYYFSYNYNAGRVAEWFKAPVLKTGRGLCSLVSSNLTPSARYLAISMHYYRQYSQSIVLSMLEPNVPLYAR